MYAVLRGLLARKNLTVKQFFAIYFATMAGLLLLYLGLTGRLHPVAVVVGAILPFLSKIMAFVARGMQFAGIIRMMRGMGLGAGAMGGAANAPSKSEIRSKYIHMILFHDTGMMDGTVLLGNFANAKLSDLEIGQLQELMNEVQSDQNSLNLLAAYLDREHEGWQAGESVNRPPPSASTEMDETEARDILGLEDEATKDDIIQAHRRMMQKMHPDRGGSTYLAARINAAKDLLLQLRE